MGGAGRADTRSGGTADGPFGRMDGDRDAPVDVDVPREGQTGGGQVPGGQGGDLTSVLQDVLGGALGGATGRGQQPSSGGGSILGDVLGGILGRR
ncbi:hypothetical protein [Ornithinimicrobium kibberense]